MNKEPRIGFVTYQNIVEDEVASTRLRVTWALPYMSNAVVSEKYDVLKDCDMVVFQTRFGDPEIYLAEKLKKDGIKIVSDFTDPHWIKEYDPDAIHPSITKMVELSDLITLATPKLAEYFLKDFPTKKVEIIPDRHELKLYNRVKEHKDTDIFKILWHGSYGNIPSIDLARKDLESLGKEFPIKLICVYDKTFQYHVKPFQNIKLEEREWSNQDVIDGLLESDISINPKFDNHWKSYKSNNKTVTAWACGIPCIERNFYEQILFLKSVVMRAQESKKLREIVEKEYDIKLTAKQWIKIANNLLNPISFNFIKEKKIAVYTSICGGFDGLRDDQFIDKTCDYFAFTDSHIESKTWEFKPFYRQFYDPTREAKVFKVLPWQYFPEHDFSIWMDGTIAINVSPHEIIDKFLQKHDMAVYKHKWRDDIYDEYIVDMTYKKKEPSFLRELEREKYTRELIPVHVGLWECGILVRRHSDSVKRLCQEWWSEISAFTSSDQCNFARTVYKQNFKINPMSPGDVYSNPYFNYLPHDKTNAPKDSRAKTVDLSSRVEHLDSYYKSLADTKCNAKQIAFICVDDITPGIFNNFSSRARNISKYIAGSDVNSSMGYVDNSDVIIYQNRFEQHDINYAQRNSKHKVVILDLSEAWWEQKFVYTVDFRKNLCSQMIDAVNAIVVSNESLKKLLRNRLGNAKDIEVIPDSLDIITEHNISDAKLNAGKYITLINKLLESKKR